METLLDDSEYGQLIGRRIRAQRALAGITMSALAARMAETQHPLSVPGLSRIENGSRPATVIQARWLAYCLDIPLAELLRDPDEEHRRESLGGEK